jgi:hypothetical protein
MDWNVIIEVILAIAGVLGLGAIAARLKTDGDKLKAALKAAQVSLMDAWEVCKKANEDKNVTQEEFDEIMDKVSAFMTDFNNIVQCSKIVTDDLYALRDAIEEMLEKWKGAAKARAAAAAKK